jgi:hypothetical protein
MSTIARQDGTARTTIIAERGGVIVGVGVGRDIRSDGEIEARVGIEEKRTRRNDTGQSRLPLSFHLHPAW